MRHLPILNTGAAFALLLLTGCQGDGSLSSYGATASAPASGVPQSCERVCNSEYDSCMDRFGGAGSGQGDRSSSGASLGPNDVCPDQMKACLRRCVP